MSHLKDERIGGLPRDLYFGGAFHKPRGGYGETFSPSTGENLGRMADANVQDVDLCVEAAYKAFHDWRDVAPTERSRILRVFGTAIREAGSDLAFIDAVNSGNPIAEMARDVQIAAGICDQFAGLVLEAKGHTTPSAQGTINFSLRQPFGVVARIVAYNHPTLFLVAKIASAVAAGNTVILKAADQTPLAAYRIAQIVDGIFPAGVVNFLTGGVDCGRALIEHPLVRRASVVGSTATGVAILKSAANKIMPVTLELGGKNPLIIFPDADLEKAIEGAVQGMNFTWAGQSCGSTSRCFVHRSIYEKVISRIPEVIAAKHKCGLPTDPATTMGSLISKPQYDKVMDLIGYAKTEGATLLCGGKSPDAPELANGFFIEPTVFVDVTPQMRLFREEAFGPLLVILPWDDEEEVIEMANDTEYGLTASIWTTSLRTAHHMADRIEAGYIWINRTSIHIPGSEFGGFKKSGIGREEGIDELLSLTQYKQVHINLN